MVILPYWIVKGPRTQIIGFLGPEFYNINGVQARELYDLGPRTFRGGCLLNPKP